MLLDAPLLYSHNNDYGWWEIEEKLAMAREKGLNMWAEYYPYEAASTAIGAAPLRPESLEGKLGLKYEEVLYDPSQDKYLSKDEYLQIAKDDPGRTIVIFNPARKDWLPMWLKVSHMVVGSDGMWQNEGLGWDEASRILMRMADRSAVGNLLLYHDDDAGGLMTTSLVALRDSWPVPHAINMLRTSGLDTTHLRQLFVVSESQQLLGSRVRYQSHGSFWFGPEILHNDFLDVPVGRVEPPYGQQCVYALLASLPYSYEDTRGEGNAQLPGYLNSAKPHPGPFAGGKFVGSAMGVQPRTGALQH